MKFLRDADTLKDAVAELRRRGLHAEAGRLEALIPGWTQTRSSSNWLKSNVTRLKAILTRHAQNARTEASETNHLLQVAKALLVDRTPISDEDADRAREQLVDVLRTVPATAIIAGTFLIPIPGAQPILAPILMERLGLLPSSWTEGNLENELRDLISIARDQQLTDLQRALENTLEAVRERSGLHKELVRFVADHPEWNIFFDENMDLKVSPEEIASLQARVMEAARLALHAPTEAQFHLYLSSASPALTSLVPLSAIRREYKEDSVLGPFSFDVLQLHLDPQENALVRAGAEHWWIPWPALLRGTTHLASHQPTA